MLHTHIEKLAFWGFRCTPSDAISPEPAHQGDPLQPDAAGLSILWVSHSNTPMVSPRRPGLPCRSSLSLCFPSAKPRILNQSKLAIWVSPHIVQGGLSLSSWWF